MIFASGFPIMPRVEPKTKLGHIRAFLSVAGDLFGIPAFSLPIGRASDGLPAGLQIRGNFFQESLLFRLAFSLEKKVKFLHNRFNPL